MKTYLLTGLAGLSALFAGVTADQVATPPLDTSDAVAEVTQELPSQPEPTPSGDSEGLTAVPTPPLIDPTPQIESLDRKLDAITAKLDRLSGIESKVNELSASVDASNRRVSFPTADEIAMRVSERVATSVASRVADAVVDKVADKVVEKVKSLLLSFQSSDGTVRKQAVASNQMFDLKPGEVLTHIDGVPVQQTQATPLLSSGFVPSQNPVFESTAYNVYAAPAPVVGRSAGSVGARLRLAPRASQPQCRIVNGVRVCN